MTVLNILSIKSQSFVILLADPAALSEVFQRHELLQPISHGIYYYSIDIDDFKPITPEKFNRLQRKVNGFIIGINLLGYLFPIYDINKKPVIARPNNMGTTDNTLLTPAEIRLIPFYDIEPINSVPL